MKVRNSKFFKGFDLSANEANLIFSVGRAAIPTGSIETLEGR